MENAFFYFYVVLHILKQILRAWMIITIAVHWQLSAGRAQLEQLHVQARSSSGYWGVAWGLKSKIMSCCYVEGD